MDDDKYPRIEVKTLDDLLELEKTLKDGESLFISVISKTIEIKDDYWD